MSSPSESPSGRPRALCGFALGDAEGLRLSSEFRHFSGGKQTRWGTFRWSGRLWSMWVCIGGDFFCPSVPPRVTCSLARWYNRPMRIPTARIRELRASPTEAEKAAWKLLRDRRLGAKFRRQFRIEGGVLDFYCFEHRLAIELDGGVHSQIDQMRKDAAKEDFLQTLGIRQLQNPNAKVLEHPDEFVRQVVEFIRASVEKARK